MEYLPTPALLGFMTYAYAVNLFTFAVLGYAALARDGVFRRQAALLLAAGVAPMTVGVIGIWGLIGPGSSTSRRSRSRPPPVCSAGSYSATGSSTSRPSLATRCSQTFPMVS